MKIKEKGLTGKSASHRKEVMSSTSRGFNAFREMAREKSSSTTKTTNGKGEGATKKDVYLEFMGTKVLIHADADGNGTVKVEDVPFVKGSTLKFEGCGGSVTWGDIKVRGC